jgi:MFS family permease
MNKGIIASITAVGVFCLTIGLSYPLLALILEDMGASSGLIGLNAAMGPIGIILSAPFVPRLAQKFGAWFICVISLCSSAVLLLMLAVFRDVMIWFPIRFFLGVAISAIFIISETWINQLAMPRIRGRIIGIYNTVAAAGFALGPLILAVIGSQGWPPFLVGITGILIALPVFVLARDHLPGFDGKKDASVFSFFSLAPMLLLAVAFAALFEQVALSFLPIYGLRHGLTEATSSLALTVMIIGNVVFQIPIGWLADRISRRFLMSIMAIATMIGSLLLSLLIGGSILLWPMLFVWGAIAFGIYTIALVELGDRFSGALLLAGNGAFGMMWGIGGIFGPPVAGAAMDLIGPEGLPIILGLASGVLVVATGFMPLSRVKPTQSY